MLGDGPVDNVSDNAKGGYRRVEVLTGPGRRRKWSGEEKARIVAEAAQPGVVVREIARRWQVTPQQLFDWRRQARKALAAELLQEDPFTGAVLVFRSRRADRVKILVWDGSGLVLIWKRLEGGAFRWPAMADGVLRLSAVAFAALFDGIDWRRIHALREIPEPVAAAQTRRHQARCWR
jgi:transposase